jgi:sigma-54 dependent transcriptional regulator, acetoin dehydrogenase operon transcriptional activator AcoR
VNNHHRGGEEMEGSLLSEVFPGLNESEQNQWLRAAIMSIHDGVLIIDEEGIVRLVNPEYTRITGVSPEEIIGKELRSVRPKAQLRETLNDGLTRVGIYRKEGEVEYVVDMAPILLNNEIIGAVSICKGLTEVHKLSMELKKNKEKISQLKQQMNSLYEAKYTFEQIIGAKGGLQETVRLGSKAAVSDLPVLISGESGTGKELFAQAIHNASCRSDRPFVPVNCAAIPASLIESELFGYEEGTFTSAKKGGKMGLFEVAHEGTIFLDEIGELSYELQAKLLRVLEEKKVRRVGSTREKRINVRVIAATNRDLHQLIEKNHFREDLFYRLNVLNLYLKPLRERREDIPEIIHSILEKSSYNNFFRYELDDFAAEILQEHDWVGNVRELKNAMDYAICMTEDRLIKARHLPESIYKESFAGQNIRSLKETTEAAEKEKIVSTLNQFGDDVEDKKKVAEILGISLATLYNKMKKHRINYK